MANGSRRSGKDPRGVRPKRAVKRSEVASGARRGRSLAAAARRGGGDKRQFFIGGVAILVIVVIIVVGLIIHGRKTAVQAADYGSSVSSTATVNGDGIITVSNGNPKLVLDFYEDAICPICGQLEHQYGRQIVQAVDNGVLTVRYHMVDFLDSHSVSGTYSTRAYAAMISVAKHDGDKPGVFLNFHSALFNSDNQPEEVSAGGTSDLSNQDLADLAGSVGASDVAQKKIAVGAQVDAAKKDAKANLRSLTKVAKKVGRRPGTPTVARNGIPVNTGSTDWLANLLPADYSPAASAPKGPDDDN